MKKTILISCAVIISAAFLVRQIVISAKKREQSLEDGDEYDLSKYPPEAEDVAVRPDVVV